MERKRLMQQQDFSQVQRQMYLLSLLSDNPRAYSVNDMRESLQRSLGITVSRKTVERDIDILSTEFCICEDEKDGNSVYYADKYHLKNIQYSIPELLSLYFTRELLEDYAGMAIANHAIDLVNRLIATAPAVNRRYLENLGARLKVSQIPITPEPDMDPDLYETLQRSLADQQRLHIEYYSFTSDEITTRDFDPYVLEIREGRWHLVGYCHLRQAVRDLRVSRIRKATLLQEHYHTPSNFYENHQKNRFQHLAGDQRIQLKLRFTGQAARLVEEYHGTQAKLLKQNDQSLLYERTVSMNPEVLMWVLGFGAEVEVLEPASLRQQVNEESQRMAHLYLG